LTADNGQQTHPAFGLVPLEEGTVQGSASLR
jgi:hypothetical protein